MNFYIIGLGMGQQQIDEINQVKAFYTCEFKNFDNEEDFLEQISGITVPVIAAIDIDEDEASKFSLCAKIKQYDNTFIVFISKSNNPDDRVRFLSFGAIATINSPFRGEELLRISSALTMVDGSVVISDTNFQVNLKERTVSYGGDDIKLTPKAYNLLVYFIENENKVISRDEIMTKVFDGNEEISERNIDTIVKQLRKEIDYDLIRTVRGVGYRYVEKET